MGLMAMLGIGSLIKNLTSSGNALNISNIGSAVSNLLSKRKNVISSAKTFK